MFSPSFMKHHGGDAVDHIDIGSDWSYDDGVLTVTFNLKTKYEVNPKYTVEIPISEDEAEDLDDDAVKEIIAEELAKPAKDRDWIPVTGE